jgi:hypothetical protein
VCHFSGDLKQLRWDGGTRQVLDHQQYRYCWCDCRCCLHAAWLLVQKPTTRYTQYSSCNALIFHEGHDSPAKIPFGGTPCRNLRKATRCPAHRPTSLPKLQFAAAFVDEAFASDAVSHSNRTEGILPRYLGGVKASFPVYCQRSRARPHCNP